MKSCVRKWSLDKHAYCYDLLQIRVKYPVHAMQVGAVHVINVVFQVKLDGQLLI
jgi:hypothetical protein